MATTNTDSSFFWYTRTKGRNWVLGVVDHNGDPIDTADLDIEYWYQEIPDEIESDNDTLPIPPEHEHGFMMGVAYEVMRMLGKLPRDRRQTKDGRFMNSYLADFEDAIYDAIHQQIQESQQPLRVAPIDLRMDQQRVRSKQRET